jgi:hypothetical protein
MFSAETPENIKNYRLWRITPIKPFAVQLFPDNLIDNSVARHSYPKGKMLFAFRRLSEKQKTKFLCVLCASSE